MICYFFLGVFYEALYLRKDGWSFCKKTHLL